MTILNCSFICNCNCIYNTYSSCNCNSSCNTSSSCNCKTLSVALTLSVIVNFTVTVTFAVTVILAVNCNCSHKTPAVTVIILGMRICTESYAIAFTKYDIYSPGVISLQSFSCHNTYISLPKYALLGRNIDGLVHLAFHETLLLYIHAIFKRLRVYIESNIHATPIL